MPKDSTAFLTWSFASLDSFTTSAHSLVSVSILVLFSLVDSSIFCRCCSRVFSLNSAVQALQVNEVFVLEISLKGVTILLFS